MVENLFRGHPPGVHPLHPNPFFIRVIRVIRGSPLVPLRAGIDHGLHGLHGWGNICYPCQTSGFGGIGAIVAANRVSRDLHVRPNVAGLGIPQMAQRPVSEDLGV